MSEISHLPDVVYAKSCKERSYAKIVKTKELRNLSDFCGRRFLWFLYVLSLLARRG